MGVVRDLLPRLGRAGWEGWFLITIGRTSDPVRWTKTHLFRSREGRFGLRRPLAAVEGLVAPCELTSWVATEDRVDQLQDSLEPSLVAADPARFLLEVPGLLRWEGTGDRYSLVRRHPASGPPALEVSFNARDRVEWARLSPLLRYFGLHGHASGIVRGPDREVSVEGAAVLEHAWGARVPFDPTRLVRGPWHWDVLACEAPGEEPAMVAGLSIPIPGLGSRGVRAAGRLPGESFRTFRGFRVEHLEFSALDGIRTPRRWTGRLSDANGELTYEARATTPLARAAPGGGFLGFEFSGHYRSHEGASREVTGTGFCECGSPTWVG